VQKPNETMPPATIFVWVTRCSDVVAMGGMADRVVIKHGLLQPRLTRYNAKSVYSVASSSGIVLRNGKSLRGHQV